MVHLIITGYCFIFVSTLYVVCDFNKTLLILSIIEFVLFLLTFIAVL